MSSFIIVTIIIAFSLLLFFHYTSLKNKKKEIPKIIWTYWDDTQKPEFVEVCLQSWKINKGYTINILNKDTYKNIVPDLKHDEFDAHTKFADYLRFQILSMYGGIWMDATIFCTESIDWIIDASNKEGNEYTGFYMPNFTTNQQYPVIENWFLACTPNSKFMHNWNKEVQSIRQFQDVQKYINHVKTKNIDLQNIPFPDYLMCHVAAQVVLQENDSQYKYSVLSATGDKGPFKYLNEENWSSEKGFEKLCNNQHVTPIIKFRGTEREFLQSTSSNKYIQCLHQMC